MDLEGSSHGNRWLINDVRTWNKVFIWAWERIHSTPWEHSGYIYRTWWNHREAERKCIDVITRSWQGHSPVSKMFSNWSLKHFWKSYITLFKRYTDKIVLASIEKCLDMWQIQFWIFSFLIFFLPPPHLRVVLVRDSSLFLTLQGHCEKRATVYPVYYQCSSHILRPQLPKDCNIIWKM